MSKVVIIGAGLSGSLLAIYLAKRGIACDVYEARPDMRRVSMSAGRSINLALSNRGIAALREVGLDEFMLREAVPMYGRMVHSLVGTTKLLPYSGRKGEYINSVSRAGLNVALMNEAEKYDCVRFAFNEKCIDFECESGEALLENTKTHAKKKVSGDTLFATDGAGSAVREAMRRDLEGFEFSQVFLEHGYKELHIPPMERRQPAGNASPATQNLFAMDKNALHIWARHSFMMIALPNFDGSFTCTLFLAHRGADLNVSENVEREPDSLLNSRISAFDKLKDESSLHEFFETNFRDAIPLMPTLVEDFFANPVGNLGTIKCFPWNVAGKSLLIGDSAHAVVPFYGQGMNCSFEDCRVLNQLIEKHGTKWEVVFEEFGNIRKVNTNAIADMAEENFYEMRDAVADPVFQRKRELEMLLEQTFPDYFSKYSMVTFRDDLPYSEARRKGNAQDEFLMEICSRVDDIGSLDLADVRSRLNF